MLNIRHISILLVLIFLLFLFISCGSGNKARANTRTKPNTEAEVGDEEALAYLEDITDPRLLALLDNFGVSKAGRKAIGYIQGVLSVSYKNGFDDKFYNCLNKLGADFVIEKIIKPTVSLLRARGEALKIIKGITDEGVKTRLQDMLNSCDIVVLFAWHPGSDHLTFLENDFAKTVTRYASKFRNFKETVKNPLVKDVYAWLDADEQATIDEIDKMVISDTYDKDKFNNVLNSLSYYRVLRIIEIYQKVKKMQEEALKAIEGVSNDAAKQAFQARFNTLKDEYNSYIRSAFNKSSGELYYDFKRIYECFVDFYNIKVEAQASRVAKASGASGGVVNP
ncbi:hypothetical protein bpSLO_001169 (plasmid) [Borrelia parkeri]|uniref:BTA121 domain-containing protein surface lipoprotein n=1 Tax=Borrelia parkeri TaxID=141 RepID=UPI001FF169BE|nr:hypothetical protein [Borrelia parkeri]UPA11316.1 hypothetical protein bpSLO_001169 [Borrelia parkeri]